MRFDFAYKISSLDMHELHFGLMKTKSNTEQIIKTYKTQHDAKNKIMHR